MPAEAATAAVAETAAPLPLEMTGIGKHFPGVIALDNVDLSLEAGKVHALMGENGAGKSTLIKILAGVYGKDTGTIRIAGRETSIASPGDALRQGIKVVFQEIALISEFTVAENIFLEQYPTGRSGSINWPTATSPSSSSTASNRAECCAMRCTTPIAVRFPCPLVPPTSAP